MKKYYWLLMLLLTFALGILWMFLFNYSKINFIIEYIIFFSGTIISYMLKTNHK